MTIYRPPALDKATPIVDPVTGRITPYFQRFWQNLAFTAGDAASSAIDFTSDIASINGQLTTINATLSGKANTASPTFTGTPAAPTATFGTSSTQLASTAFVQAAVGPKLNSSAVSTFALTLIDDADATAARTTLGLGTAATQASTAFALAAHTHIIANVTGLQTALDAKVAKSSFAAFVDPTGTASTATFDTATVTLEELAEAVMALILAAKS